jgi:hypothetical protein
VGQFSSSPTHVLIIFMFAYLQAFGVYDHTFSTWSLMSCECLNRLRVRSGPVDSFELYWCLPRSVFDKNKRFSSILLLGFGIFCFEISGSFHLFQFSYSGYKWASLMFNGDACTGTSFVSGCIRISSVMGNHGARMIRSYVVVFWLGRPLYWVFWPALSTIEVCFVFVLLARLDSGPVFFQSYSQTFSTSSFTYFSLYLHICSVLPKSTNTYSFYSYQNASN